MGLDLDLRAKVFREGCMSCFDGLMEKKKKKMKEQLWREVDTDPSPIGIVGVDEGVSKSDGGTI